MPEKFQENLKEAIKTLQIADHMTYVTLPLINEKRLLLKIFDEIYKSITNCIWAILNYEHLYKKIDLYSEESENIQIFINQCAKDYGITNEQIKKIRQIIELNREHKQSAMEFTRQNKIVILSDSLRTQTIDIQRIKEYLLLAKELVLKINMKIRI
jgi:Iap family predicted aminopeptidase